MEIVEDFAKWPTGNIADALSALGYASAIDFEIRPIFTPIQLAGRALPIKVERGRRAGDKPNVSTIAKESSKKGDVIILACGGYRHGDSVLWGENSMVSCWVRGAVGAIIDGGLRDSSALIEQRIPIYTRARSPGGRTPLYAVDYNVPILCGGIRVNPEDIVIGDEDGVCIIPKEIEEETLRVLKIYGNLDKAVAPALREGKSVEEAYSIKRGWQKKAGLHSTH